MALRAIRKLVPVSAVFRHRAVAFLIAGAIAGTAGVAYASESNGTITAPFVYAWGERIGWLNFNTSGGNVHITDTGLTGYAWSDNYGWINLAPPGSGVTNNGAGDLGGYAWGENLGYIDFSDVSIDAGGQFRGTASSTNTGRISFDCGGCVVMTEWRFASSRPSTGSGGGAGGGGGSVPAPQGVRINADAAFASSANVSLKLTAGPAIAEIMISNFADFRDGVREPYVLDKAWSICNLNGAPRPGCPVENTVYTVYVRFISGSGQTYGPYTDSILYATAPPATLPYVPPPTAPPAEPPKGTASILDQLYSFITPFLPGFLKPKPLEPGLPPVVVSREAPLAFRGAWQLIPREPVREFVFAPLSRDFLALVEKFPALKRVAEDIGIARQSDLQKLRGITLALPGFTGASLEQSFEAIAGQPKQLEKLRTVVLSLPGWSESALPGAPRIPRGVMALPPGIPLANLPIEVKESVPSDVVFARTGAEKIDLDIGVRLDEAGEVEQRISTVSGSILKLVVRPSAPAKRVAGYLTFTSRTRAALRSRRGGDIPRDASSQGMLGAIVFNAPGVEAPAPSGRASFLARVASLVDAALGRAERRSGADDLLAIREFEYTDPDGDGLYTATIQAPVVDGEYAIHTFIDYVDPALASREIRLITVVDPEGYVYEEFGGRETRIPGAIASIYWLNPDTKEYELWPAGDYAQENPQVTDVRGTYAFLTPPGWYYLSIEAPGYDPYDGKPFEVRAGGSGVHMNIELTSAYGFLRRVEWKTVLLILLAMLVAYNFYRDRRRAAAG